jgi:glycosyltransferase involved in cell wall biosynthesis
VNYGLGSRMKIDAVIPTVDRAEQVVRAVESALAQTRPPTTVIVADDGSTDGTADALAALGPRVRRIELSHGGVAAARNAGVAASDADFVAFLDDDDVWDPGHLERIARAIDATSGEAWLYFADLRFAAERADAASIWEACGFTIDGDYELRRDATVWGLLSRQPMMTPASVVRRDAYESLGGQARNLVSREDTHLFLKLCLGGPVCAVAGAAGEAGPAGLSARELNTLSYWECTKWLYADVLERHPELRPEQRAVLREQLAQADWQLARAHTRKPLRAAAHLARSIRTDPRVVVKHVRRFGARYSPARSRLTVHA